MRSSYAHYAGLFVFVISDCPSALRPQLAVRPPAWRAPSKITEPIMFYSGYFNERNVP